MSLRVVVLALLMVILVFTPFVHATTEQIGHDLSGHWEGRWQSCRSGHQGVLRADFCQLSDASYRVHFSGRFFKVFPFRYSVDLDVVEVGPGYTKLRGSSYLGRIFGTFCYEAIATECDFQANYNSKKDHGWFRMTKMSR